MSRRLLAAAALVAAVALTRGATEDPAKAVDVAEVRAPEFEKALKSYKGKVVVIDCWATWCAPCVKKFPHLVEMHKKYADKGLVCVSLSLDKAGVEEEDYKKEKIAKFLKDKEAAFPNFIVVEPKKDEEALTKLIGDYTAIPYMVIFDRAGKRVWTSDDKPKLEGEKLDKFVEELLGKP